MSEVVTPSTAEDKRARLKRLIQSGEITLHPLTLTQRELYEATPVPAGDVANHICCIITIRGKIKPDDAREAIQMAVARQEALRLSILPGKDRPLQAIRKTGEATFRFRELPSGETDAESIEAHARRVFAEPFDLVQGPLFRVEMLGVAPDHFVLAMAMHHLIGDGWSLGVFVQDLCAAYLQVVRGGGSTLPPVPQTYSGWGAADRENWQPAAIERLLPFWRQQLGGTSPAWGDVDRRGKWKLERHVSHIPPELAAAAKELARRSGATLFSTLLTAFQVTLWAWKGIGDLVVGSPVANRQKPADRETMGSYAGVVPLRGRILPKRTFTETLRAMHDTTLDCFANAMPFVELARALGGERGPERHPIFETRFALQNHPIPDVDLPGLSAKLRMRSTGTARFHLGCEVTEEDSGMEIVWLYREAMLDGAAVAALDARYQAVLAAACRAPETRVADFAKV